MDILPYIVDGFLVLLFVLTIVHAARKGLACSAAGIVAWLLAAFLALHFCAPAAEWIYTRLVHDHVVEIVRDQVSDMEDAAGTADLAAGILAAIPEGVVDAARSLNIDVDALMEKASSFDLHTNHVADAVEQEVIAPILLAAIKVLVFFAIVLLGSGLAQTLLRPLGTVLHKIPVIGTADRTLGGVLGILKGAVLVSVLAMMLRVAQEMIGGQFGEAVSASKIVAFVAESPFSDGLFRSA